MKGYPVENAINYVKIAGYLGAAFAIGIGTIGPALGQGLVASKACENIGKYPESAGKIRAAMMLGMAIIETSPIYVLAICLLLIFVS